MSPSDRRSGEAAETPPSRHAGGSASIREPRILSALRRLAGAGDEVGTRSEMMGGVVPEGEMEAAAAGDYEVIDPAQLAMDVDLPPVVRLVTQVLTDAAKGGASDVHVEPQ